MEKQNDNHSKYTSANQLMRLLT